MGKVCHHDNTKETRSICMQQLLTIAVLNNAGTVLMMLLLERLKSQMEMHLSEEQSGFENNAPDLNSETDCRKAKQKGCNIIICFIEFQKSFDFIKYEVICVTPRSYGGDPD